jgi:hypothetical protein
LHITAVASPREQETKNMKNKEQIRLLNLEASFLGAAAAALKNSAQLKREQAAQEEAPPAEDEKFFGNDPEVSAGCAADAEAAAERFWDAARKARELIAVAGALSEESAAKAKSVRRK